MQAVKVGWVGQTFALAKCSDSTNKGKKTRTRRTKEERRTMVESFINKYRSLNKGNFPSLNLTHKEVGGSFYTVREIVREIIQDNRVLGPAGLSIDEHDIDQGSDKKSFESLSSEPQSDLSLASTIGYGISESPNKILFLSKDSQSVDKELLSTSGRKSISKTYELIEPEAQELMNYPNQSFHEGIYLNAKWMDEESKEAKSRKLLEQGQIQKQANDPIAEISVSEEPDGPEKLVESSVAKETPEDETIEPCNDQIKFCTDHCDGTIVNRGSDMLPINGSSISRNSGDAISADMIPTDNNAMNAETSNVFVFPVEIFPVKSSTTSTFCSNERTEGQGSTETVEVLQTTPLTKKVEVESELVNLDRVDSPESLGCITQGKCPTLDLLTHGTSNFSENIDLLVDISHNDALIQQTVEQEQLVSGVKIQFALSPNDVRVGNIVTNADSTHEQSLSSCNKEAAEIEPKMNLKNSSSAGRGSDSALDGINSFASGRGVLHPIVLPRPKISFSESSKKEETNPVWAVIKAFIASLVKFWVE